MKAGVALLISHKADYRAREIIRYKKGYYIIIKESIIQEEITILNVYSPNNIASKYMRQNLTELQGEIDESASIVGEFNTPLSIIDRSSRQKTNKDVVELNNIINQLNLIDIYILK